MKLTTTVYKYKRSAPWMLVLIVLATVLFFFFSTRLHPLMNAFGVALLVFFAVYAVLRPKSIFSLRSVDERKLMLTPDELMWGTLRMPVHEVEKLEIYIHAFDTFKHSVTRSGRGKIFTTEYGDRNTITFVYRGIRYDLTFYLGTFNHYDTLVQIIKSWREKGIDFSARSAFTDNYIREQVNRFGNG
jgi:Ca2+/Na+ antiporter